MILGDNGDIFRLVEYTKVYPHDSEPHQHYLGHENHRRGGGDDNDDGGDDRNDNIGRHEHGPADEHEHALGGFGHGHDDDEFEIRYDFLGFNEGTLIEDERSIPRAVLYLDYVPLGSAHALHDHDHGRNDDGPYGADDWRGQGRRSRGGRPYRSGP